MELDAFTSALGVAQGRVTEPSGEVRFVIGHLDAGQLFDLMPGDHAEVTQSIDVTTVAVVRVVVDVAVPAMLPPGLAWEVSITVDGIKRAAVRSVAGQRRRLRDLTTNVSKFFGVHTVGVRVELVEL
jgi:hypothetical protein